MRENATLLAAAIAGMALLPTLQAVQPSYVGESVRMSMTQRLTAGRVVDLGEPVHFLVEGNPTTTGEFAVVDLRSKQPHNERFPS